MKLSLGGTAPEDRDFVNAVYGNFIWVLRSSFFLTFVLLMRAFRSVVLALKAVVMNLVSLAVAFGDRLHLPAGPRQRGDLGPGGDRRDHRVDPADDLRVPLRPLDGLRGVHALAHAGGLRRVRRHAKAIESGLARTGKLVTSAALVLMFAFFSLSIGPGPDIKQFAIGARRRDHLDATLIRALLVPSLMRLFGDWNWWFPEPLGKLLFVRPPKPLSESES